MDPRERLDDQESGIQDALRGLQAKIWTALPGIIQSFNAQAMTAVVQPAVQLTRTNQDGSTSQVTIAQCKDCPVVFPHGGGVSLTFPIADGDECLLVLASRCIDAWWQQGGVQPQMEVRLHDLSDGFCIPGPYSQPKVIPNASTTTAQLRSDAGTVYVEVDPRGPGTVNVVAPASLNVTSPDTTTSGNVLVGTGASGSFTTFNGLTVTVQDGIITNIF
jgi:hypothetical protein